MHPYKAIKMLALMQLAILTVNAQQQDTTLAVIDYNLENNQPAFYSILRPLHQRAGAPGPFYSYFWEFGDGHFSFEKNPRHGYKDTGTYSVRLFATNNYDDGKPPPTRPRPIKVRTKAMYALNKSPGFFKQGGTIEMKVNRMPRADEDMVLIIGYRNENTQTTQNGSLVLFYNEKLFNQKNFDLADERTYYGEKKADLGGLITSTAGTSIIEEQDVSPMPGPNRMPENFKIVPETRKVSDLLQTKLQLFRENNTWRFDNLEPGGERYLFLTLHTTPEMIRDTNAVVTMNAMYIPEDPGGKIEEYSLELQIVASHDPNRMMLKTRRLNYRFTGSRKENLYKVLFQNTGKGPARQVSIGVAIPDLLDNKSVELLDYQPKAKRCDSVSNGQSCLKTIIGADSIHFVFNNIYLPGLQQEGFTDPDSTIGFVHYRIRFSKGFKKVPFLSRASIVFDKNDPVSTNGSKGFFKPGRSLGVIVGYNRLICGTCQLDNSENYWSIGGSLSEYSPYRKYFQFELFLGMRSEPEQLIRLVQGRDTLIGGQPWFVVYQGTYQKSRVTRLDLVPLQIRYNLTDFAGAGAGTMVSMDAITSNSRRIKMEMFQQGSSTPVYSDQAAGHSTNWFNQWDLALFGDLQLGKVRVGPAAGIRFLHYFRVPQNRLFIYVTWRF